MKKKIIIFNKLSKSKYLTDEILSLTFRWVQQAIILTLHESV